MHLLGIMAAVLALSACTGWASSSWQKQGAEPQTVTRDTANCHDVARGEAWQRYPYQSGRSPAVFGVPSATQSDDLSRSAYEAERFDACMAGLGYQRG